MRRNATRFLLLLLLIAAGAHAADEQRNSWFTFTIENDWFVGKDTGYTNGFALSWGRAGFTEFSPDNLVSWLHFLSKNLYISTMPSKQRAVSYMVGQLMQTPSDLNTATLIENEAPYAGLLFWTANLHAWDERVADRLSLTLGVVGPLSGAEQTQKWIHDKIGADEPMGWDNQIENEPVFQVSAERLLRLAKFHTDKTVGMDVIGIGSGAVGNLESYLALGVGARLGRGLDRSFPGANFMAGPQVNPLAGRITRGWNVFANVQGRFVANDIGINGNTFKDSHSVPLEHWQAAASAGVAVGFKQWAFLMTWLAGTNRYEGQPDTTRFGSLSITYNY
jgi:hypothetical protein